MNELRAEIGAMVLASMVALGIASWLAGRDSLPDHGAEHANTALVLPAGPGVGPTPAPPTADRGHTESDPVSPSVPNPVAKTPPFPERPTAPHQEIVTAAASWLELDPALIHAIIQAESSYRPDAISHRGAIGLMQLVPTAGARDGYLRLTGRSGTPKREALFDPETNIWLGAAYFRSILDRYLDGVPEPARLPLALAAYNWGPTNVRRRLRRSSVPSSLDGALSWVRRHCPAETVRYVQTIVAALRFRTGNVVVANLNLEIEHEREP